MASVPKAPASWAANWIGGAHAYVVTFRSKAVFGKWSFRPTYPNTLNSVPDTRATWESGFCLKRCDDGRRIGLYAFGIIYRCLKNEDPSLPPFSSRQSRESVGR